LTLAQAAVVIPGPGLKPALDRDLLAFAQVPPADLGQAVPDHDVVELPAHLAVAGVLGGRETELSDVLAAGERPHFGVSRQSAGEHDLVHGESPS
jgi:hypothetical protein